MEMPSGNRRGAIRALWVPWVLVTTLGCGLGLGLGTGLSSVILGDTGATSAASSLLEWAGFGAGAGLGQALLLRPHVVRPTGWAFGSVVSFAVGVAVTVAVLEPINLAAGAFIGYPLTGLIAGFVQWRLAFGGPQRRAGWWAVASAVGFFSGVFAAIGSEAMLPAAGVGRGLVVGTIVGLVYGLITATAILLMLRSERRVTPE